LPPGAAQLDGRALLVAVGGTLDDSGQLAAAAASF
jgi:hypothetical protein